MANKKVEDSELLKELMKEFERDNPAEIKTPMDFMNYERNMLSFVLKKARELTQMKIDSLGTSYQGTTVKKNDIEYRFVNNRQLTFHGLFGKYARKRAYYSVIGADQEDRSGYAPFDHMLGITERYTPACGYFLDLFTVRGAFQESMDHFHEIFRADGIEYIPLLKAEQIMRAHGAGLEKMEQERISTVYAADAQVAIEKFAPIDGTMIIAQDATKIRHRDGEKSIEIKGNNRRIKHYGFKDGKIALVGSVGKSPENKEPRTENMTYVAAIEPVEDFIKRVYTEMQRRGGNVTRKVFIGDGADWILDRVDELLDDSEKQSAIKILDYYHPKERFVKLAQELYGEGTPAYYKKRDQWLQKTYHGKIKTVLNELRSLRKKYCGGQREKIDTDIRYFEERVQYMRYDVFRAMGLPIGSGAIESACGHVIGGRLKGGGMAWAETGADSMLTARCSFKNGTFFEDYQKLCAWQYTRLAA